MLEVTISDNYLTQFVEMVERFTAVLALWNTNHQHIFSCVFENDHLSNKSVRLQMSFLLIQLSFHSLVHVLSFVLKHAALVVVKVKASTLLSVQQIRWFHTSLIQQICHLNHFKTVMLQYLSELTHLSSGCQTLILHFANCFGSRRWTVKGLSSSVLKLVYLRLF